MNYKSCLLHFVTKRQFLKTKILYMFTEEFKREIIMSGNTLNFNSNMPNGWTAPNINFSSTGFGALGAGTSAWSAPMFNFGAGNTWGGGVSFGGSSVGSSSAHSSKKVKKKTKNKVDYNASRNFKGLTRKEEKLITEYSTKKQEYVENLGTSLAFGAGLGVVVPNMNQVAHPFSAANAAFNKNSVTNKMFQDVVKQDIWKKESILMQDAYAAMNRAEIRANKWSWQGLFKRGYTNEEFEFLQKQMKEALQRGNADEIAEVTMKLKNANNLKEGWFSRIFKKPSTTGAIDGYNRTLLQSVDDKTGAVTDHLKAYRATTSTSFKNILRDSAGLKDASGKYNKMGIGFALLSLASEWRYIKAGFNEDTETGFKQLGQSIAKAGSSWGGYVLGSAIGKWGGAKLGSMIGTAVCPGLGTAIGAVAGFVCGTVCSWGLRKLTNWIVGDNVANKYIAKNEIKEAKTDEQKAAFINNLVAQAQKDKDVDEKTLAALAKASQAMGLNQQQQQQALKAVA